MSVTCFDLITVALNFIDMQISIGAMDKVYAYSSQLHDQRRTFETAIGDRLCLRQLGMAGHGPFHTKGTDSAGDRAEHSPLTRRSRTVTDKASTGTTAIASQMVIRLTEIGLS